MSNIKIAVAGNVDSGKSTLIGVLTNGILDDGRGHGRSFILRNKHEKETGRTSSISVNHLKDNKNIMLIDLAGHEKYLKTTMYGLNGMFVDYGIIVVGSNMGLNKMTKEHMGIMLYLKIPFIVVITKIDICPKNVYDTTIKNLKKVLNIPLFNKKSFIIKTQIDLNNYFKFGEISSLIPVISISNKTGENLDYLKLLINNISKIIPEKEIKKNGSMIYIDSVFNVIGIGMVLTGFVKGKIKLHEKLFIGPINNIFIPIKIKSIHNNFRENVSELNDEEYGCIAVKFIGKDNFTKEQLKKKGIIGFTNEKFKTNVVLSFKAEIKILHHSSTIKNNYTPIIHCGQVRQSAKLTILDDNELLRTGDIANVLFTFVSHKEYIEEGNTIFFRDGSTKGFGKVISLHVSVI